MIIIAIGANLPGPTQDPPLRTCQDAVAALEGLLQRRCSAVSRWYETPPVPPTGQPPYVNGIVTFEGESDPAAVLHALHGIEARFGRQRSLPNAARTLDLDIIAMGSLVRAAPDPILPHPRMHERTFVLQPMMDVAPDWLHPTFRLTTAGLLAQRPQHERQDVRPIPASHLRETGSEPI